MSFYFIHDRPGICLRLKGSIPVTRLLINRPVAFHGKFSTIRSERKMPLLITSLQSVDITVAMMSE
jgi:hypothetical protein